MSDPETIRTGGASAPENAVSQPEAVRRHFDRHSEDWESVYGEQDIHSRNIQLRRERVLGYVDRLALPEGSVALDLGCGAGLVCVDLLKRGYRVIGADVAGSMVEMAKRHCIDAGFASRADIRIGNAEALEFEDGTFDLIIGMGLIEYLTWDRWALQEMLRVLKPGGSLIVTVPNRVRISELVHPLRLMRRGIRKLWKKFLRKVNRAGVSRRGSSSSKPFERNLYWPGKLDRTLRRLGCEIVASGSHGFGPFPILRRSNRWTLRVNALLQKAAGSGWLPFLERLGSNYNVLCRYAGHPAGAGWDHFPGGADRSFRIFRKEYRKAFARLDQWLAAHPRYSSPEARSFGEEVKPGDHLLVLSPHPDDEVIGCGGTLLKLGAKGARITIVMMTDGAETRALRGEPEESRPGVRLQEAREVAGDLGAALVSWKEPDSALACEPKNVERLADLLDKLRPRMIFVPFVNDFHPDHVAANRILAAALEKSSLESEDVPVLAYEVWAFVPVNLVSGFDGRLFDQKARLLMKYRTGMKVKDYVGFCRTLNAYHAHVHLDRKGFAEGFLSMDAGEYRTFIEG